MEVSCTHDEVELENENGRLVPGVRVCCGRCDNKAEAFGTSGASVRRALASLRDTCPENERNFYTVD